MALTIAAGLAESCSSSSAPELEQVEQQDSKLTSCGTPFAVHTTTDAPTHVTVSPAANLFVPSTVQATGAMWYTYSTISASVKFGSVTCLYSSSVPQAPSVDLAFVSCTGGVTPGTTVFMSTVEFWGSMNGYTGTAGLDVALGRSLVSTNPCIINTCQNNVITPSNAPEGTQCDSSNVCLGIKTCDVAGGCTKVGAPPPTDDGDVCTTDTACIAPSTLPTHTRIAGCGAPDGGAPPYPGNATLPSDFAAGAAFLYTGGTQTGMTNTIYANRAAIVRGRVINTSGAPISGATVKILGQTGYGQTISRSDGYYDLAVNGGDTYTVDISLTSYPTVQRKVATRWLDFSVLPDVVMTPLDTTNNVVNLDGTKATIGWQKARGTKQTELGLPDRQATLLIPPGTKMYNWTPSGSTLHFRATEFTVGANGPAAMPADLPSTSAYTYALDFSIDEATQPTTTFTNADSTYANSVIFYVEHFIGPGLNTLGQASVNVPSGYYDRTTGMWKPETSGRIVRVYTNNGTTVTLSLNGTSAMTTPEMTALGITSGELQQLAPLYTVGTDLWRVRMPHFSAYDLNWNAGIATDARRPPEAAPRSNKPEKDPCSVSGSVIECENQVLGESIPIAGTPFSLNYRSETQSGYHPTITVPISDENTAPFPQSFDHGEVEIVVAGRRILLTFGVPAVNQRLEWTWDRTDAYGRAVQGTTTAHVRVSYVYKAASSNYTTDFAKFGTGVSFAGSRGARTISLDKNYDVSVGGLDAKPLGLGGWTLSANHVYETSTRTAWLGTGQKRDPRDLGEMISLAYNVPSGGGSFRDVAVAGDGSVYLAHPSDTATAEAYVAGLAGTTLSILSYTSYTPSFLDGAPLGGIYVKPLAIAVGPDDYVYVAEYYRIIKFNRTNQHNTYLVAGTRSPGSTTSPDDTVAVDSPLQVGQGGGNGSVAAMTFGADGLVYFSAPGAVGGVLRRIKGNGTLDTVAGTGSGAGGIPPACSNNTCRALAQPLTSIEALASDPQGGIYLYDRLGYRVWRMAGDNTLRLVAGLAAGTGGGLGDGGPALSASLWQVHGMAYSRGSLYLSCGSNSDLRVRRVAGDGTITTVAGDGTLVEHNLVAATSSGIAGDGTASMKAVQGPDGYFTLADGQNVRRFGTAADPVVGGNTLVMSPAGDEVYKFNSLGQHLFTSSPFRGAQHYSFAYADSLNRLTGITDAFAGGVPALTLVYSTGSVAITSQFGRTTTLHLDSNGYLDTITNPNTAEVVHVTHSATGLLQSLTDALGKVHTFSYTPDGLLARDKNALANTSGTSLTRNSTDRTFSVLVTSPEGRGTLHTVDMTRSTANPLRVEQRTHVSPAGLKMIEDRSSDGFRKVTYPQVGTTVSDTVSPDPRFSFGLAYLSKRLTTGGASKTNTVSTVRTVLPAVLADPFALTSQTDSTTFSPAGLGPVAEAFSNTTNPATLTTTTPTRSVQRTLDAYDRVQTITVPGSVPCITNCPGALTPVQLAYTSGILTSVTQGTRTSSIAINGSGFVTSVSTPLGGTVGYSNHDAMGRPKTVTLPGVSRLVQLTYDLNGNVQKVTTPRLNDHLFAPNALDVLGLYTPPLTSPASGATGYTYDADSLLLSRAEPQATVTYSRDMAGRVTNATYPTSTGATESVTTTYDPTTGNVTAVNSSLGPTLGYTYDGTMVTDETLGGAFSHPVHKTYDNYQRVTDRKLDGLAVTNGHFVYDTDGRLSQITQANLTNAYTINRAASNGLLAGTTMTVGAHSLNDAYEYNALGDITRYRATLDGATIYDISYIRDPASGRITDKTESIGVNGALSACSAHFDYDYDPNFPNVPSTHFLTKQTGCAWGGTFSYDANGNNLAAGATFDAQDRVDPTGPYGYDADGDTTSLSSGWTYSYDVPGNLRRATNAPGWMAVDYVVDGKNRRRGFTGSGLSHPSEGYVWDGNHIIGMENAWGLVAHFFYATKSNVPDLMYAPQGQSLWTPFRLISDPLGSVKMVIRVDTGAVVEWHDYSTWGIPVAGYSFDYMPFGFAGGLYDSNTGLYRYGARDYNPWSGRWWSKDPSRFGGGLNLYEYANNDPVNLFDPTGNDVEVCSRVADLPLARDIGLPHKWLRTGSKEAGLGALGQGVPGAHADSPYVTETSINDHTGEGDGAGATCQVVKDVDEDCVNKALAIGCPMGPWSGYNQCWTMVYDILDRCSTKPPPPRLPSWVYRVFGFWAFLL